MEDRLSDEELMLRFCEGDSAAFDALFARHSPGVHAFLVRLVQDRELARDLSQATFLSFVRSRGRWERGSRVAPWLYAIAANAARDARRRRRRRPEDVTNDGEIAGEAVEPSLRDPGLEKRVAAALASLPASQREAVVLHRFQHLSFDEIAQVLGTSVGAAKVRAHRGYERLRELLKDLVET